MNLSCTQVSSLLSFYIDNKLNRNLADLITQHLKICPNCREKYDTLKKIFSGLTEAKEYIDNLELDKDESLTSESAVEPLHKDFALVQTLSSYLDNELSDEESLKVKKYVVTNLAARKTLEEIYSIKKLMHESFERSRILIKEDFSKYVFKQLNIKDELEREDPMARVVSMLILIAILFVTGAFFVFLT